MKALWAAVLLAAVGADAVPKIVSYGPLPQTVEIYDHVIPANSMDYWSGPRTMDMETLEYTLGEQRFRNPSNYGLNALSNELPTWRNRVLHYGDDCGQKADLTDMQTKALSLIAAKAESIPNGGKTWRYNFALNFSNLIYRAGFNSAFAQSTNIAALLFAECKTKDRTYLDLAREAGMALITPISEGGLMNPDDGLTFFEELPGPPGVSPYILNAHLLSTNVLFALAARTGDEHFAEFAKRGVDTFLKLEPQYTDSRCIRYALKQRPPECVPEYDEYETVLLEDMAVWTGNPQISKLADLWRAMAALGR